MVGQSYGASLSLNCDNQIDPFVDVLACVAEEEGKKGREGRVGGTQSYGASLSLNGND